PPNAIHVIFGDPATAINYDEHSGFRLTAGYWFDAAQTFGLEASFFQLERRPVHFAVKSEGEPVLGRLFHGFPDNLLTIVNDSSVSEGRSSRVNFDAIDRFWGVELNARYEFTLFSDRGDMLFGFRHLQYDEGFVATTTDNFLPTSAAPGL